MLEEKEELRLIKEEKEKSIFYSLCPLQFDTTFDALTNMSSFFTISLVSLLFV